jgi:hypothetical protein
MLISSTGFWVDAEQRDVHHVGQPAEKPVCNKIRIVRGKNDMIKDYILNINATIAPITMATSDLMMCHLSSSSAGGRSSHHRVAVLRFAFTGQIGAIVEACKDR